MNTRPLLILTPLLFLAAACSDSKDDKSPSNSAPPTVDVTTPATATQVEVGEPIEIRWTADDPDDEATCAVFAVGLNVGTTVQIATGLPENPGVEQSVVWTPQVGEEGSFALEVRVSDADQTTVGTAPGVVEVGEVPFVEGVALLATGATTSTSYSYADGAQAVLGVYGFDPETVIGPGEDNEVTVEDGDVLGLFVTKYGSGGELLWVFRTRSEVIPEGVAGGDLGGTSIPYGLAPLEDGGVILSVNLRGTVVLAPGQESEQLAPNFGGSADFLVRLDGAGEIVWVRPVSQASPGGDSYYAAICGRPDGGVIVAGEHAGLVTFGAGTANEVILDVDYGTYMAAFDADGEFEWVTGVPLPGNQLIEYPRLAATMDGIWMTAAYEGAVTFDAGGANETVLPGGLPDVQALLAHYGTDGTFEWAIQAVGLPNINSDEYVYPLDLVVDPEGRATLMTFPLSSETYVVGLGQPDEELVTVGGDEEVELLVQFDAEGALSWVRPVRAASFDEGDEELPTRALTLRSDGSLLFTAAFDDTLTTDGTTFLEETGPGLGALFVACFGADGGLLWGLNDGGNEISFEQPSVANLPGDRVLVVLPANLGSLEVGTNDPAGEVLPDPLRRSIYRVVYEADGSYQIPAGDG